MARRVIDEERLLQEALNEFTHHSFEKASLNRIIVNAGITKGSFYYRYSDKYELYISLIKEANKAKWEFIKNETKPDSESPDCDLFALFLQQAQNGMRFAEVHPEYYELSKMLSREKGSPVYQQVLNDLKIGDDSGLESLIEESFKAGFFKDIYTLEFLNKIISSLFFSFDDIFFKNEEYDLDKAMSFLEEFVTFMKCGLAGGIQEKES